MTRSPMGQRSFAADASVTSRHLAPTDPPRRPLEKSQIPNATPSMNTEANAEKKRNKRVIEPCNRQKNFQRCERGHGGGSGDLGTLGAFSPSKPSLVVLALPAKITAFRFKREGRGEALRPGSQLKQMESVLLFNLLVFFQLISALESEDGLGGGMMPGGYSACRAPLGRPSEPFRSVPVLSDRIYPDFCSELLYMGKGAIAELRETS